MKILFACGGTAGHINPALAVAGYIKKRKPDCSILFAGNPKGMEATLVPKAGYAFAPIVITGFQRKLNFKNIKYNVRTLYYLMRSGKRAKDIIESFQPDVVVGTGGYVSGPILMKAAKLGYKTVTHEQNAFPGITTKALCKYVDKVLLAVPEAKKHLKDGPEYTVVGNPIREDIIFADREKARQKFGVGERVCLVSFGGSLGARVLNEAVVDVIEWHHKKDQVHHIHATGKHDVTYVKQLLEQKHLDVQQNPHIDVREYIDDMADCLAAADIVISRAGAITLSELQATGNASILIPSPNVSENHQYHNAMVLASHGAAVVIEEKNLTGKLLCETLDRLISDREHLKQIGKNAQAMAIIDSTEKIYHEILELCK